MISLPMNATDIYRSLNVKKHGFTHDEKQDSFKFPTFADYRHKSANNMHSDTSIRNWEFKIAHKNMLCTDELVPYVSRKNP
jgi:hypothetical protein